MLVLTGPASCALGKVLRWTPWRRCGGGSTFAAVPTEQTREEHTHPALPSSGTHAHWVPVCRLSTALPCCAFQLEVRDEALSLSSFTLKAKR